MNLMERFEQYYIPEPNSGCWLWTASLSEKGYGWFYYPPRNMVQAHIVAYELFKGPRNGLHVRHCCDVRCCVNPDHLELGTHQDNMADRDARGRQYDRSGAKNGRAKLTEVQVLAIRADARWPRFVAADYGVPLSTVKKIRQRVTWKHL